MKRHDFYWKKLWKKIERVSKSVVTLLQSNGSKNAESGRVYVFVIWDPDILLHIVNNLDAVSETEQLINAW